MRNIAQSKKESTPLAGGESIRKVTTRTSPSKDESGVVLIIGAAGFVGSRIAKAVCDLELRVIGIDNQIIDQSDHLLDLRGNELFEIVEADILEGIPPAVQQKHITHVIYAADVLPHVGENKQTLNRLLDNSVGLKNALEFANKMRARVIYTSSVDIYQGLASHEQLHNYYDGKDFSSYYAYLEGKRYGEALCREYVERFGLDIRIARFPEIYGPGMDLHSHTVLGQSINLALQGKDLILQEVGSREHQVLYIDDAVYGLIKLLFNDDERSLGGIFYFVSPERISTLSIVYTLKEIIQRDLDVEFIPLPHKVGLPEAQKVDISRSEKILTWTPHIDLTQGLERTLEWFLAKNGQSLEKKKTYDPLPLPSVPIGDQEKHAAGTKKHKIMPTLPLPKATHVGSFFGSKAKIEPTPTPSIKPELPKSTKPVVLPLTKDDPKKDDQPSTSGWMAQSPPVAAPVRSPKISKPKKSFRFPTVPKLNLSLPKLSFLPSFGRKQLLITGGVIGALFVVLIVPVALLFITTNVAFAQTRSLNYDSATRYYGYAQALLRPYEKPAQFFGLGNQYEMYQTGLLAGLDVISLLQDVESGMDSLEGIGTELLDSFGRSDPMNESDLRLTQEQASKMVATAVANMRDAQTDFGLLKKRIESVHERDVPGMFQDEIHDAKNLVWLLAPTVENSDKLLGVLPELLGFINQRRYVVLLQNNNEIRPTGGFIGSYVAFNVNRAQFNQFKVDDIYNPDGLLEPHVNPPEPEAMKKYLDVEFLGARDSNWWPDFPTSADVFITLYERATNERLDGVVAVNLSLIQKVLAKTGPVYLETYQEEVTAQNVFDRAQTHAEVGFQPGSTKKRDFLSSLNDALFKKLSSLSEGQRKALIEVVVRGLASRDIVIQSNEPHVQEVFETTGLAGRMITNDQADYVKVVDSNVGGNKSNYWVDRTTSYAVDVDRAGKLKGRLTLRWHHRGTSTTWPNGDYKNYLRVYLPLGVQNIKVDPPLPDQASYPSFEKTVVEGLVDVPINTTQEVVISYSLPDELSFAADDTYQLVWENQPGIVGEKINFTVNLPSFLSTEDVTKMQKELVWPSQFIVKVSGTEAIQKDPAP